MELLNKKLLIINFIKTGMDLYSAQLCAHCTDSEIEQLEQDEDFKREILVAQKMEEYDLLQKHKKIINIQVDKGQSTAVQWKLSKINPDRWGRGEDDYSDGDNSSIEVYIPDNKRDNS